MWGILDYPYNMIIPPVGIALLLWWRRNVLTPRPTTLTTTIIFLLVLYGVYVVSAELYDLYLGGKVLAFDLDGDGIISPREETPEFLQYSAMLTNDAGRVLAPLFGVPYALICAGVFWLLLVIEDRIRKAAE